MKVSLTGFLVAVFIGFTVVVKAYGADPAIISDRLFYQMESLKNDDGFIRINIIMREEMDAGWLMENASRLPVSDRRRFVVETLMNFASVSQEGVLEILRQFENEGLVREINPLWIANVITCSAKPSAVYQLANRTDIYMIDHDFYQIILDPSTWRQGSMEVGDPEQREITWNVSKVNAPQVWALGYTGQGVVVAIIDTGVNYNHNDLKDHLWQHPDYPMYGYNFVSNNLNPMDDQGHGTHCAGTVAGDGTSGSQTGVAPDATIMCLKVLDSQGGGNQSWTWSAVQFAVQHGADILSLSLGWQHAWGPNRQVFRQTFNNALAAGVIASVAAGNEGDQQNNYPIPDNVRTPGDCPPPWLHPDQTLVGGTSGVVCVGATNSSDAVAAFSGRGPSTWQSVSPFNDYPYQPGIGLIRPDVVAPGVNIKSLAYNNNSGYASGWNGTSMATPCVAGVMALMKQKNSGLTPQQISQILEQTTVVLTPGKNNTSGSGRVNALAAINATPMPGPSYYSHTLNDQSGNNNGQADPGESILLTVAMANFSDVPVNNVTVKLSSPSPFITITDSLEFYGNFAVNNIIEIQNAFAFNVANNIPGGQNIKFNLLAISGTQSWTSSFTITANGITLTASTLTINDASGNGNGILDPGETASLIIQIGNQGQIPASTVICSLTTTSPGLTINNGIFTLPVLNPGQNLPASFSVTVSPNVQTGTTLYLSLQVVSGFYQITANYTPKVGLIVEDFESGTFTTFPWQFAGNQPWQIANTGAYQGQFCARSGQIGNNQSSELKITMQVAGGDSIAFYRKVSSEANYDFLRFYINNTLMGEWSGEVNWGRVAYPVTAGTKTFRWVYIKDIFVVAGQDRAWVDYIEFPAVVDQTLSVNAGPDATICQASTYQANATAQNHASLIWSTSGTGTFSNPTILNPIYYPSQQDIQNGSVILTITVYGNTGASLSDQLILSIIPIPQQPGPISGPSTVCMGQSELYHINPVPFASSYEWILTPWNAGTVIGNDTTVTVTFSSNFTGNATLKVYGINQCGGGNYSADFPLVIEDCTGLTEYRSVQITVSPNPAKEHILIKWADIHYAYGLLIINDPAGRQIVSRKISGQPEIVIDTRHWTEGVYFLKFVNEKSIFTEKIIISRN